MKQSKGLGDKVESIIETILPTNSTFRKAKSCGGCQKRKEKLNEFGELFT